MPSEPKTKPTDASVADFIAAVESPKRRADAQVIHDLLTEVSGEQAVMWGPSIIGYGQYLGPTGYWPLHGFSPRKANLVLYFAPEFPERQALLARLGPHRSSVSCVYVTDINKIDLDVVRELAVCSAASTRARHPD
jgi:hypothetical protein